MGLEVIQDFWDDSNYMNKITGIEEVNTHMIKLKANDGTVIEKAYKRLMQKGVKFISQPMLFSEGFAKVCFCFDPNNTRIELVEML
jgi:hypothetical protein